MLSEGETFEPQPHDKKQPAPLQQNSYSETEDITYPIQFMSIGKNLPGDAKLCSSSEHRLHLSVLDMPHQLAQKKIIVRINNHCKAEKRMNH